MVQKNNYNKSAKKSYNGILIIAGILGFILLAGLVIADRQATLGATTPGVGSNLSVINEDVTVFFNITINTTQDAYFGNVTQVNVTIPSSFTFTTGSNRTDPGSRNGTFNLNSSTVLTWTNFTDGFIGNGSNATIGFNITATNPGNYSIIINVTTFTAGRNQSIINVNVNDTTAPYLVSFNSETPVAYANLSKREIVINVSANDTFSAIGSFNISILFPNGTIANTNATGIQRNVTIDLTAPTVSATKSASSTAHQVVLDITLTDATSGIVGKQCSATSTGTGTTSISGTGGSQTATQTGLGCSTDYTYTITCSDYSGNSGSKQVTVSTDGCPSGGTSGTSGGTSGGSGDVVGSASSSFWILTYNEATNDLNGDSDGVSSLLLEAYRVKIKVDTKLYYVGVTEATDTTAKINVTTTAKDKEATLSVGDVKKFDVNADNLYDISVTLNGIDSATGKADLTVVYTQEPVSAEDQEGVEEQVGEEGAIPEKAKPKTWLWVVVVLVVLAIAGAILFGKKKARHKNYGF
ncbi:hypothetical protein HYT91_01355 [Candidatus Pacearchaeota archaeon]|nr:hypothetical protein [Candidatus Pacearchaeota archaeon]